MYRLVPAMRIWLLTIFLITSVPGLGGSVVADESRSGSTFEVEVLAENLEVPWAMAFSPDGRLFFTERPGRIRVIEDGKLLAEPWAEFFAVLVPWGETGVMGIAVIRISKTMATSMPVIPTIKRNKA